MKPYKRYKISFDEDVFDVHFRSHVRNFWRKHNDYSYEAYARHVRQPLEYILRVASGADHPNESILRDMQATVSSPKRTYKMVKYGYTEEEEPDI